MRHRLLALAAPEGAILAAAVLLGRVGPLQAALAGYAPYYPLAVVAGGALLAWRFRQGRAAVALLALGLAELAFFRATPATGATPDPVIAAAAVLLPLDLAALSLLPERGLASRAGLLRLAGLAAQAVLVAALHRVDGAALAGLLAGPLLPGAAGPALPAGLAAWTALGGPAVVAAALGLGIVAARLALRPDATTRGLFWAIAAATLASNAAHAGGPHAFHIAAAGSILVVSVLEGSYAMAFRDALTGLPSRRAFDQELQRLGRRYTIAMVNVDHFKRCNDRYGHGVGDQVLRMVATRLARASGRPRAFRYGGEEFALVFRGKPLEACLPHLERVRTAIESTRFTIRGPGRPARKPRERAPRRGARTTVPVTVSIGAAERNDRNGSPGDVTAAADRALYRAKEQGRNRVMA